MTVIAYRAGIIAADTGVWSGNIIIGNGPKLSRSPKGSVAGGSGRAGLLRRFHQLVVDGLIDAWLEAGATEPLSGMSFRDEGDFGAIFATRGSGVWLIDDRGCPVRFQAEFYAEGGAREMVMGAMAVGASAAEAVEIAIRFSDYASGRVETLSLCEGALGGVHLG